MKESLALRGGAPQLPGVLGFLSHLWALHHALQAASKRMEKRYGVTGMQRLVVRLVGHAPGISAGGLATALHVHPSTLTGVLSRLVERGVLRRVADPIDARRAMLGLTDEGRRVDRTKTGTVEEAVGRALAKLDPQQIDAARAVLSVLEAELSAPEGGGRWAARPDRRPRTRAARSRR